MQELIILTPQALQALLTDTLSAWSDSQGIPNPNSKELEIIGRHTLCQRLGITEVTAIRWEKKGKIPCFRIGSSVRYNWSKVIEALEQKGGHK